MIYSLVDSDLKLTSETIENILTFNILFCRSNKERFNKNDMFSFLSLEHFIILKSGKTIQLLEKLTVEEIKNYLELYKDDFFYFENYEEIIVNSQIKIES
jgi:hypothetical protein